MDKQMPFKVEYAKSNKIKCKICHCCIPQKFLIISKRVQFRQYVLEHWHHIHCILSTSKKPESISLIANFDNIKWDDQEVLKEQIESESLSRLKLECVSSKNKCFICKNLINKGHIKICIKSEHTRLFKAWHLQCFADQRDVFNFFSSGSILPGFSRLKKKDQSIVLEKLPTVKDENLPPAVKKAKLDALKATGMIDLNILMKKQNEKFFTIREEIQQFTKDEMIKLLVYNDQRYSNTIDTLMDILSDRLAFGCVNSCTKCGGKNLFISGYGYACTGQPTLQKNGCGNISKNPERSEFKIPPNFTEKYAFLENYVFNVEKRLMRITAPSYISLNLSACDDSEQTVDHPEPINSDSSDKRDIIDLKIDLEDIDKIYQCDGVKYSVTLGATDSHSGQNSLYKLQIWRYSNQQKYSLLHIWSENNMKSWKLEPMPLDMCIKTFKVIFWEKSGNLWIKRDQFIKQPFKMDLINN